MLKKKVSIIIPIYNVLKYIDVCINSAINQTYTNIEIILVDDGSPDGCGEKCDEWRKKDNRIKVIHKVNGGLSSARNAGLDVATGEYVLFLDGDDYIKDSLLEEVIPYMEDGYDMVSFNYYKLYGDGKITPSSYCNLAEYCNDTREKRYHFFVSKLLRYKLGYEAWARVFKKEIIDNYNIRFADNRIVFAEDVYFSLCYCAHCKNIINLDKILYYYRQHQTSIMSQEISNINIGRMNELGKAVMKHYKECEDCKDLLEIFPVIYYLILDNVLSRYIRINNPNMRELRSSIIKDITDLDFFRNQLRKLSDYKNFLYLVYTNIQTEVVLSNVKYFLNGNLIAERIRYQIIRIYAFIVRIRKKCK